jgi:cyanophycinase
MKRKNAKGKLVIIGGAEDKKDDRTILKEFVQLAGGSKARIVVMTVATDLPEEVGDEYTKVFKELGVKDVRVVDVSERTEAENAESLKSVKRATGLYFTGGDQLHITSLLGGTEMNALLHERREAGVVFGGTSAGAAMMSNSMIIRDDTNGAPRFGDVNIGPGLDLLPGTMIDTHFSQRGRFGRLLTAVAHYPQDIGIGIDENTGVVVDGDEFSVIGENTVSIVDAGTITYTNLPGLARHEPLTLHGVVVHVLSEGQRFNLKERKPLCEVPKGKEKAALKKRARAHSSNLNK